MSKLCDTFLLNCAEILLNINESDKEKICDVKFVCSDKTFHSFKVLLTAISPTFLGPILRDFDNEADLHSVIILPPEISYQDIFKFHQSLLIPINEKNDTDLAELNLEIIALFGINENYDSNKKNKNKKSILKCLECGKEYVSEACFRNHMKIHEQEYEALNRTKKVEPRAKNETDGKRPKRSAAKPKRFSESVETVSIIEDVDEAIRKQRKTVKNNEELQCKTCVKSFASKQTLENHMKLHTDDRQYSCEKCGKSFITPGALANHSRVHSMGDNGKSEFPCPHCDKSSNNASNLARHIRNVHFELSDMKQFSCSTCAKSFKDPSALSAHEKIHSGARPHHCDVCLKGFVTKAQLKIHYRIHTGERPYNCDQCSKSFKTKDHLRSHKLHRHIGVTYEKNHLCSECGASFVKAFDLKIHALRHSGETPFDCHICEKSFRSDRNLKTHLAVHSGEKSFDCETCGKAFKSQGGLKQHLKVNQSCQQPQVEETQQTMEIEEEQVQAYMIVRDGEHYFQLEDGQLVRAEETIYTIKDDSGETKVAIVSE